MSTWFRDYVYIPLGVSRNGIAKTSFNLLLVFALSGLWHGAGWNFVVWGVLHGMFLVIERATSWTEILSRNRSGRVLAWVVVMVQVWTAWVFFRAESADQAIQILGMMWSFSDIGFSLSMTACFYLVMGITHEVYSCFMGREVEQSKSRTILEITGLVFMLTASVYLRGPGQEFIYFQF